MFKIYTHVAVRQVQVIHRATRRAKLERKKQEEEQDVRLREGPA